CCGGPPSLHSFPTRRSSDLSPDQQVPDALLQFAKIAGPPVIDAKISFDPPDSSRRERLRLIRSEHTFSDESNHARKVVRSGIQLLAKRWRPNHVGAQPIIEVLPEASGANQRGQILMCRR